MLLVQTWHGIRGRFNNVQDAVDAANPGDWILVGPGLYHPHGHNGAGVYVTKQNIHIRGMNRNTVVLGGTKTPPAGATTACPSDAASQDFGPLDHGKPAGRNGIWVNRVDGVSIENLTVCNFLSSDSGENRNEIWWNGGDGTGQVHLGSFTGRYLTATSTYYKDSNSAMAKYGIFADNTSGPGLIADSYASDMGDSAYYIGACPDCNTVLTRVHAEGSALGYSGTNSGGHLILEYSEWDRNRAGVVPNSLNNDDAPSPQNGACPPGEAGPTGTSSCTVLRYNHVHHNNNPNVPAFGIAGAAPVGAGIEISGGSNDTIVHNHVDHQGGWGIVIHDYPDTETPPPVANCQGGTPGPNGACYFTASGNEVASNTLDHNGFFANPGDVDLGLQSSANPGNCFHDNTDPAGLTSDPENIQTVDGTCGVPNNGDPSLAGQLVFASGVPGVLFPGVECPNGPTTGYPRTTNVVMLPLPKQKTMPNPCAGVPANPWCSSSGVLIVPSGWTGCLCPALNVLAALPPRRNLMTGA